MAFSRLSVDKLTVQCDPRNRLLGLFTAIIVEPLCGRLTEVEGLAEMAKSTNPLSCCRGRTITRRDTSEAWASIGGRANRSLSSRTTCVRATVSTALAWSHTAGLNQGGR